MCGRNFKNYDCIDCKIFVLEGQWHILGRNFQNYHILGQWNFLKKNKISTKQNCTRLQWQRVGKISICLTLLIERL